MKGTFKKPDVGVSVGALAARGGAMVGLRLINPFAALIPLIAPSNNKPLPCQQMLADMSRAPSAPAPGQKEKTTKAAPAYMSSGAAATDSSKDTEKKATPAALSASLYKGS